MGKNSKTGQNILLTIFTGLRWREITMRFVRDFFEIFFLFWGGGQNSQKWRWGEALSSSWRRLNRFLDGPSSFMT